LQYCNDGSFAFQPALPMRPTNLSIGQFGLIRRVTDCKNFGSLN